MRGSHSQKAQSTLAAIIVFVSVCVASAVAEAGSTPRTPVPEELRGDWMFGTISPTDFFDGSTGAHLGNAYGVGVWFSFGADGSFKQLQYNYSTAYSCRVETWTYLEGTVTVADGLFRTYPTVGKYRVANNCARSQNYTRPMTDKERGDAQGARYSWSFEEHDGDGRVYLMIGPGGDTTNRSHFKRPEGSSSPLSPASGS